MLGLDLIAAHLIGDFLLQTGDMANRKLECWKARALHVTVYVLTFLPILWISHQSMSRSLPFLGSLWIAHFITDSRRWASGEEWAAKPIVIDQTIHVATLAAIAHVFLSS